MLSYLLLLLLLLLMPWFQSVAIKVIMTYNVALCKITDKRFSLWYFCPSLETSSPSPFVQLKIVFHLVILHFEKLGKFSSFTDLYI